MKKALILATVLGFVLTGSALAARPGFGPRVGWTHDNSIDQFHFGGQAVFTQVLYNLRISPNLEVGLGDGWTILAFNGDFVYEATEMSTGDWGFYAGIGLALNRFDRDVGSGSTDFGINALIGTTLDLDQGREEAFLELRLGLEDSPDLKLTVGVTFF